MLYVLDLFMFYCYNSFCFNLRSWYLYFIYECNSIVFYFYHIYYSFLWAGAVLFEITTTYILYLISRLTRVLSLQCNKRDYISLYKDLSSSRKSITAVVVLDRSVTTKRFIIIKGSQSFLQIAIFSTAI